jgi:pilus assembly protein Flp/PilA
MLQFVEALRGQYVAEEQEGQGLVEYALIIAFIAVVVIVAMVVLQGEITTLFSKVGNPLTYAPHTTAPPLPGPSSYVCSLMTVSDATPSAALIASTDAAPRPSAAR